MVVYYWLIMVFLLGATIGSFLNVCISRLPMEKSILWPNSRCGSCLRHIRWYHNLPLVSYLWLRGRCGACGAKFSVRYFIVELLTALGFVGLFYGEVICNMHAWPVDREQRQAMANGVFPWQWWVVWLWHAVLFSFLMAAAVCDLDGREIPLPLTLTGTVVGLLGAVLFPWPWPRTPSQALPRPNPFMVIGKEWQEPSCGLKEGLYPWPVWGPLPNWLPPGSWELGLVTGLAGLLLGTFMLRGIGFLFSRGLGREALGLGDADLMMMAGAFLGWQPVVVAFFASVLPAMVFIIVQKMFKKGNELPFGPSLGVGIMVTALWWPAIYPEKQLFFFWAPMLAAAGFAAAVFMLVSALAIRLARRQA